METKAAVAHAAKKPLTIETVQDRSYPLAGEEYFYLDRKPGQPLGSTLEEFLRYVLSRDGQQEVMRDGKFLPLTAKVVHEQLKKLRETPKTTSAPGVNSG